MGGLEKAISPQKNRSPLRPRFLSSQKVRPAGFEPATLGSEDRYSIQLNYGRVPTGYDGNGYISTRGIVPDTELESGFGNPAGYERVRASFEEPASKSGVRSRTVPPCPQYIRNPQRVTQVLRQKKPAFATCFDFHIPSVINLRDAVRILEADRTAFLFTLPVAGGTTCRPSADLTGVERQHP